MAAVRGREKGKCVRFFPFDENVILAIPVHGYSATSAEYLPRDTAAPSRRLLATIQHIAFFVPQLRSLPLLLRESIGEPPGVTR